MGLVQFSTTEDEERMIEELKPFFKTTTKAKVFRGSLRKTYDLLKDIPTKR